MARRDDQHDPVDEARLDACLLEGGQVTTDDPEVHLGGAHPLLDLPGVADAERHLDPPVARLEPAEQPREQIDARRRAPAEQEGAAVEAAQLPHCVLHSLEHREDAPGVLLEETARLGQADAPTEPVEERRVEPALQLLDLLGQRRLTEGEPLRRAAEAARARDGEEDLELTERHRMPVR